MADKMINESELEDSVLFENKALDALNETDERMKSGVGPKMLSTFIAKSVVYALLSIAAGIRMHNEGDCNGRHQ